MATVFAMDSQATSECSDSEAASRRVESNRCRTKYHKEPLGTSNSRKSVTCLRNSMKFLSLGNNKNLASAEQIRENKPLRKRMAVLGRKNPRRFPGKTKCQENLANLPCPKTIEPSRRKRKHYIFERIRWNLASSAKADSTLRSSQAVPHPSTNRALSRLTSEVRRDPVYSTRYGRQRQLKASVVNKGRSPSACPPSLKP